MGGQIPDEITQLRQLFNLDLRNNLFDGTIPQDMGNMVSLATFTARNNKRRSSPGLVGTIPASIGSMRGLVEFDVSDNRLTGQIPPEVANLEFLGKFIVSQNNLVGSVP